MSENFNSQPHKEADDHGSRPIRNHHIFQLTASQGGWRLIEDICEKFEVFQLTASQGGWQRDDILTHRQQDFNSQPHKEADSYAPDHKVRLQSFQLTASQGGWLFHHFTVSTLGLFQLTASQGGWLPEDHQKYLEWNISTHSLTRRLTVERRALWKNIKYFNSQPHKEADIDTL